MTSQYPLEETSCYMPLILPICCPVAHKHLTTRWNIFRSHHMHIGKFEYTVIFYDISRILCVGVVRRLQIFIDFRVVVVFVTCVVSVPACVVTSKYQGCVSNDQARVRHVSGMCQKCVRNMRGMCERCVRNASGMRQGFVNYVSGECVRGVSGLSLGCW